MTSLNVEVIKTKNENKHGRLPMEDFNEAYNHCLETFLGAK